MEKTKSYKKVYVVMLISLLLIITATAALADSQQFRSDGLLTVEEGMTVKGPVFYSGNQVRVSGVVDGMAFIAGGDITIDGVIQGDLFVVGQKVTINGQVMGDLYGAGSEIQVNGQVNGDALMAGDRIHGAKDSLFARDVLAAGGTLFLSGAIERQLLAGAQHVVLDGAIGDDSRLSSETLQVRNTAVLQGDLSYTSANEANVDANAVINGKVTWDVEEGNAQATVWTLDNVIKEIRSLSIEIVGALLVWYIFVLLAPGFWVRVSGTLREAPLKSFSVGLLTLIVTPLLAVIALVTVIGVPTGMLAFVAYGVGIYMAKIVVAVAIGYTISSQYGWKEKHNGLWFVLLGFAILAILSVIPVVRTLVFVVVLFGGLGALLLYLFNRNRKGSSQGEVFVDA